MQAGGAGGEGKEAPDLVNSQTVLVKAHLLHFSPPTLTLTTASHSSCSAFFLACCSKIITLSQHGGREEGGRLIPVGPRIGWSIWLHGFAACHYLKCAP